MVGGAYLRFSRDRAGSGILPMAAEGVGMLGTTGVATGMALLFFLAFLEAPGFLAGLSLSSDELSVSESEYSEQK